MKKTLFLGLAMAGIALNPLIVSAAADSKYPAADFEPSVIYIDKDAGLKISPKMNPTPNTRPQTSRLSLSLLTLN